MRTDRLEAFSDGDFAAASLALCFLVAAYFLFPDRAQQLT